MFLSKNKKRKEENKCLSAIELKAILSETLEKLIQKKIGVEDAYGIAMQSREIIRVIKSQQSIINQAGKQITKELIDYAVQE